jgi:uncharacterized protein YdaU (DUF1376 family)
MKADTWMPLYPGDWLRDTMHLSRDEQGGYFLLTLAYWVRGEALPDDDRFLMNTAKATAKEWKNLRPVLSAFFDVRDGKWWHKRIEVEMANSRDLSHKRRIAGANGNAKLTQLRTQLRQQPEAQGDTPGVPPSPSPSPSPSQPPAQAPSQTLSHCAGAAETDGVPSVAEVRTWAQMSGVDPDWAEDRHGYLTERDGWVANGRLVDWQRMFKRWSERNKTAVPKNTAPEKNAAPVSDARLRSALAALSAQAVETADLNRVRTEDGDVS